MKSLTDVFSWVLSFRTAVTMVDPLAVVLAGVLVLGVTELPVLALAALAAALVCSGTDLQRSRLVLNVVEDLPRLLLTSVVATLTLAGLSPYVGSLRPVSLGAVLITTGAAFLLLVALRGGIYAVTNALRRRGVVAHPVIIVGAGPVASRLARALLDKREYGLVPVGVIDAADTAPAHPPVPMLGGIHDLERAMVSLAVDDIIFAFAGPPDHHLSAAVRHNVAADRQVFVVPQFFEMMSRDHYRRTEVIHDIALLRLRRWAWRPSSRLAKRLMDVAFASVALLVAGPVMALTAAALRLETGHGVIFHQTRVGQGGRTFTLYKFQTMRPVTVDEGATTWNIDNDARIGRVGRFLRRTGLDELPQIFNVLRGDMSLVGPRPERPHFVQEFSRIEKGYVDRHRVQTGITGFAQVNHLRGDTSIAERVRFDNHYIENWSLWGDVKIMWRTLPTFGRSEPGSRDIIAAISAAPPEAVGTPARARALS